jgi:translation initiation factor 2B subunit (eIF-2B alpha/beta/delta family)
VLHLVAPFLRHEGRILLVRRESPPHEGRWDVVSDATRGSSGATLALAREAAAAGVAGAPVLETAGESFAVAGVDRSLTVHPYLFAVEGRDPAPGDDRERAWVHPPAIRERDAVPWLAAAYDRVAPDLATVREDRDHGSVWVAARALEVLRDRAATAAEPDPVAAIARALRDARPTMAVVANRVNRAMAGAATPAEMRRAAERELDAAADATRAAASATAALLSGPVATCSRSGTVLTALSSATVPVVVGESRLGREGVATAEALGDRATLVTDAVLPGTLAGLSGRPEAESVLLGADAILPDGSVVNRTGSYPLALAATQADTPVRVVATRDKVRAADGATGDEREPPTDLYDGDAPIETATPLFERVPADLVDAVVTEDGVLAADDVAAVAADHREAARWDDGDGGASVSSDGAGAGET